MKHGELPDDPVYVCSFEKALSAGQLIDFGEPVRPVMDYIEQLSIRQLVHSRMVSLSYLPKFLTALVTGQENPVGAQLPCFPDEVLKVESLLACFESYEEALLDWVRQSHEASTQWHEYASIYDPLSRRLFEVSGRTKSELCRRRLFGCYESN